MNNCESVTSVDQCLVLLLQARTVVYNTYGHEHSMSGVVTDLLQEANVCLLQEADIG